MGFRSATKRTLAAETYTGALGKDTEKGRNKPAPTAGKDALKAALTPVWFDLPESFWRELADIAEETGLKPAALISRGIKLCRREHRGELRPHVKLPRGEWINAEWMRSMTPEERTKRARFAASRRWKKDPAADDSSGDAPVKEPKKLKST